MESFSPSWSGANLESFVGGDSDSDSMRVDLPTDPFASLENMDSLDSRNTILTSDRLLDDLPGFVGLENPDPTVNDTGAPLTGCDVMLSTGLAPLETPPRTPAESSGSSGVSSPSCFVNTDSCRSQPCSARPPPLVVLQQPPLRHQTAAVKEENEPSLLQACPMVSQNALQPEEQSTSEPDVNTDVWNSTREDVQFLSSDDLLSMPKNGNPEELRAYKRHLRKIRNREAAYQSRRRKKEHLDSLEGQVKELIQEKTVLVDENRGLKTRLSKLQEEYEQLRKQVTKSTAPRVLTSQRPAFSPAFPPRGTKPALASLFVICVFVFGFQGMDPMQSMQGSSKNTYVSVSHRGRTLLSYSPDSKLAGPSLSNTSPSFFPPTLPPQPSSSKPSQEVGNSLVDDVVLRAVREKLSVLMEKGPDVVRKHHQRQAAVPTSDDCQSVNKTQARRIVKTLSKSFRVHQSKRDTAEHTPDHKVTTELATLSETRHVVKDKVPSQALRVKADLRFQAFLKAMDQRVDTFYVVSLKDHFLFPATHVNKTRRPLMSLVMPAIQNDSSHSTDGQVSMMRIDCEVVDTAVVQVPANDLPLSESNNNSVYHHETVDRHDNKPDINRLSNPVDVKLASHVL